MSLTPELDQRIRAALTPDDYQALVSEMVSLRAEASTQRTLNEGNLDVLDRVKQAAERDGRLARVARTVALRFSDPSITLVEEREARQALIDAYALSKEGSS